jgi:hypothetical protein
MDKPESHPWIIRWVHRKWPAWVKFVGIIGLAVGWVGNFMGWGGWVVNTIHAHDNKVQIEALAVQLDKQHDAKVDQTLDDHTKDIKETKAGVAQIQSTLAKDEVELLGNKDQLNRIENAIMAGAPKPVLSSTPHP